MVVFCFDIFIMKWFEQEFTDCSQTTKTRLSSHGLSPRPSRAKTCLWNPGFGIFNFNSLIIFMLSLISTFLTLIVLWSILNFDNLDIKRKYDDHPKIIYSFVTVLENSPEWSPSYAFQRWCEITTNRLDRRNVIVIFIMHNLCIIMYMPPDRLNTESTTFPVTHLDGLFGQT